MKYSPTLRDEFCNHLTQLSGRVNACKAVGISYETFTQWMAGNLPNEYLDLFDEAERETAKLEFSEHVKKAESEAMQTGREVAILAIFNAMGKQWQAAAWWLERKFSEEFMERKNLNLNDSKDVEEARAKLRKIMEDLNAEAEGSEGSDSTTTPESV